MLHPHLVEVDDAVVEVGRRADVAEVLGRPATGLAEGLGVEKAAALTSVEDFRHDCGGRIPELAELTLATSADGKTV